MTVEQPIVVYGAYGHTGRFIVSELLRRGFRPVLAGRDSSRLQALSAACDGLQVRVAAIDDSAALRGMLRGSLAVVNAAGPFALTASAVIDAAIHEGVHYLDVAAEPDVVAATIAGHERAAVAAHVSLAPAIGFYGGLGHLAAAAAIGDWTSVNLVTIAFALSSWHPTDGTRATIEAAERRREGRRLAFADGQLRLRDDSAPVGAWDFPSPIGRQPVLEEFTTADSITLSRRFQILRIGEYMTLEALKDLTSNQSPAAVDESGRSAQTFLIHANAHLGDRKRTVIVRGRDIYAVTAPLVVETLQRILVRPGDWRGILTVTDVCDAREMLDALAPAHFEFEALP